MTKEQRQYNRAKAVLSAHDNEIIGQHMPKKKKSRQRINIFYKNKLKMDHRPKCKTQSYKSSTRKCGGRWPGA